jgi:hypothetical protein
MSDDAIKEKKREQKLRFIEILLIVGGIISSLGRLWDKNPAA